MSLLMEALKKAEESKRRAGENGAPEIAPAATNELTLAPMTTPGPPPGTTSETNSHSPLPDLSLHYASVDADLATLSTEAPARQTPSSPPSSSQNATATDIGRREATERAAVRNVFSAKQAPKPFTGLRLFVGLGVLAALGLGGYFWWQLQSVSVVSLARPMQPQLTAQSMAPAELVRESAMPAADTTKPVMEIPPPPASPARSATAEPAMSPFKLAAPPPVRSETEIRGVPDSPVRLSRKPTRVNQTLEYAYASFQSGNLDQAKLGYEQVLRNDAKNTDALLGLATIAARQGQTERAQEFYLLALESDPNDATAQAGLINLRGQTNPGLSESRLKTLLASQPDSSALHFALGNLYARQARWSEAQQAYFRAYSTEPDSADIIFNLAVSLDHLHQNKLAAEYYQRALNIADGGASHKRPRNISFDRNQVSNRILELRP